jgi:hypothetical protein
MNSWELLMEKKAIPSNRQIPTQQAVTRKITKRITGKDHLRSMI